MPDPLSRRTLLRRSAAAAVALGVGGLFTWRELLNDHPTRVAFDDGTSLTFGLSDDQPLALNQPAPGFVLPTLDGEPVSSTDFRGKTLVLNFWASWCPPCRAEMPDLQALHASRAASDDLVVLAVDFLAEDTVEAAAGFVDEFQLTLPVVADTPDGNVAQRYGIRGLPATFFIDRNGILRKINLGPVFGPLLDECVAAADAAVDV